MITRVLVGGFLRGDLRGPMDRQLSLVLWFRSEYTTVEGAAGV